MMIKYVPPTTFKELQNFQKNQYNIESEIWKSISLEGFENYKISNYGRLMNIKKHNLIRCNNVFKLDTVDINSLYFYVYINRVKYIRTICDLMLHAFYPDIFYTHINPIPIDGNIFNLSLDNIKFVSNSYYEGDDEYRKVFIYINDNETIYTIDTNGIIKNNHKNKPMRSKYNEANDIVSIYDGIDIVNKKRSRWMAESFIYNPNNLRNALLIDSTKTVCSLYNICWTNRPKYTKQLQKEIINGIKS